MTFSPATNLPVGSFPHAVAIGDLNGDGKLDLAVLNYVSSSVSILLGTGTGSFGSATTFGVGSVRSSVPFMIVDLNGDGKIDLAAANDASNHVSILLGDGTGAFGVATNFTAGTNPISVAIGDINGDGKPDLAVANLGSNNVSILLGDGAGAFGAATNFAVGLTPHSLAIGDLNGDGKLDLAVANHHPSSNSVSILIGTGTGSFGLATNFAVGGHPRCVAIGDINGDGKPDLAVGNSSSNSVSILLGTGTGSFGLATNFAVGTQPHDVAIGDMNGDGKLDVAAANRLSNNVSILLGTGTGSFGSAANFAVGTQPQAVAIGDFNGDGRRDLAVGNTGSNNVSILLNATNRPPGAHAGPNQVVESASPSGTSVTLDGTGSGDPDGDTLTFEWKDASNNVIGTTATVNVTAPLGTSTYTLTVTDPGGLSSTATTEVTVQDTIAPAIQCGTADGLWHADNVSINCTATDGGSGPAVQDVTLSTNVAAGTENANASTNSAMLCDAANNCSTAGPVSGNMIDRKAPSISITAPAASSYLLNQSAASGYSCTDGGSGAATCVGPVASGSNFDTASVGAKSFTVTATDVIGNSTSSTVNYSVGYAAAGMCLGSAGHAILQPVNADGTSVFKKGSTVPAKFRVCDASGNSIGSPGVVSSFRLIQTIAGTVSDVDEAVYSTTPDAAFRWDANAMQWIFNINTKTLAVGTTYVYRITLNDGSTIDFQFGLK